MTTEEPKDLREYIIHEYPKTCEEAEKRCRTLSNFIAYCVEKELNSAGL